MTTLRPCSPGQSPLEYMVDSDQGLSPSLTQKMVVGSMDFGVWWVHVEVPAIPLTSSVSSEQLLHCPNPLFPPLENGGHNIHLNKLFYGLNENVGDIFSIMPSTK